MLENPLSLFTKLKNKLQILCIFREAPPIYSLIHSGKYVCISRFVQMVERLRVKEAGK